MRHWQNSSTGSEGVAPIRATINPNQTTPELMAIYSQASDLQTRQTVWIGTKVSNLPKFNGTEWEVKEGHQANSHTRGWQDDGLPSAELADLHTSWQGWVGPGHRYQCNPEAPRISCPA